MSPSPPPLPLPPLSIWLNKNVFQAIPGTLEQQLNLPGQRWEQGVRWFNQAGECPEQLPPLLTSPGFLFSSIIVSSGVCEGLTSHLRVFHETGTNGLTFCPSYIHKSQKAHPCCCLNIFFFRIPFFLVYFPSFFNLI